VWEKTDTPLNTGNAKGFRVFHKILSPNAGDFACLRTSRLTGNFPGSPLNLRFFFGLDGDKIASLEIIP
jgi:hypothetical protein